MNKFVYSVLSVLAVLLAFTVSESNAYDRYGDAVDSFCLDSNPYRVTNTNDDCLLCHTSNKKSDPTTAKDAYMQGDLCYFCADDTACVGSACVDGDGDGYFSEAGCGTAVDCNDAVASINPGAPEVCDDSIDNNCDGNIDAQDPACGTVTCTDADGDGYAIEGGACGLLVDCNDADSEIYPGATDICNDGIDQDCSGKDRTKGKGCKTTTGKEGKGRTCSDNLDNDGDGLYDCSDPDCGRNRICR